MPWPRPLRGLPAGLVHRFFYDPDRAAGVGPGPRLASALRKRWAIVRHPHATIRFGPGSYVGPRFSLFIPHGGTFVVGRHTELRRGFRAEIVGDGRITIGDGCFLTYDVIMACTTSIDVGDRVGIGQASFVADGNHRYRDLDQPFKDQGYVFTPLRIADDVAIHSKCTILADVGRRAVVGANAVVNRPVAPFTLAAGVPARALDYFGPPEEAPAAAQAARNAGASS